MTDLKNLARDLESITFTEESLAYAVAAVSGYGEFAPELVAEEIFKQLAQRTRNRPNRTPMTVWLSRCGGYSSKLEAVRNGEQLIAPALVTWKVPA
ncbi:hypothetical protein [Pseudomonas alabamensis]|uniref:hypothetical protein n=1 Tax=Pseudomonas alabamensis TaxID=3064349 RepID=UPI003F651E05